MRLLFKQCACEWFCVILFQVPYGEVMTKTLVFAVYDYDRFSKHDAIGEVRLPVCQMDLAQAKEIWKELQSIVGDGKVSGYFSRSCCFRYISANLSAARNFFFNLLQQNRKASFYTLRQNSALVFMFILYWILFSPFLFLTVCKWQQKPRKKSSKTTTFIHLRNAFIPS